MSMNAHQALQDALAAAPAEANPVAGSQTHTHRRNRHAEIARYQHGSIVPDVDADPNSPTMLPYVASQRGLFTLRAGSGSATLSTPIQFIPEIVHPKPINPVNPVVQFLIKFSNETSDHLLGPAPPAPPPSPILRPKRPMQTNVTFNLDIPPHKSTMAATNTLTPKIIDFSVDYSAIPATEAMALLFHPPYPSPNHPVAKIVLAIHIKVIEWGNEMEKVPHDLNKLQEKKKELRELGGKITGANVESINPELVRWMTAHGFMAIGQAIPDL